MMARACSMRMRSTRVVFVPRSLGPVLKWAPLQEYANGDHALIDSILDWING